MGRGVSGLGTAKVSAPRILFGLGATKAGTSWLHQWLSGHPECHFRTVKELHYFDALDEDRVDRRISELRSEKSRARSEIRQRDIDAAIDLLGQGESAERYLSYLDAGQGASVVGDITPAYGLLPVDRLRAMAALGETRFLYILRDPVARLWSHVRMIAGRREPSGNVTSERAGRILKRVLRGEEDHIARRGDYAGVIGRMREAVPEARRLVVFFDDLFAGDAAQRICEFLGIAPHPVLARVVHGGQSLEMTADQARAARAFLSDQYTFVEHVMGHLPDAWMRDERV